MNRVTKIILFFTAAILIGCISFLAYKVFAMKDVQVLSEAWCDPETEGPCYIWVCEPDWGTECTGDPEEDIWIYKLIDKKAYDMPACEPIVEREGFFTKVTEIVEPCPEQECPEGTEGCETIYCDPETEECYDDALWNEYVATLKEQLAAACENNVGDYLNNPDYCEIAASMDAVDEEVSEEELLEEEGNEEVLVEEEQ